MTQEIFAREWTNQYLVDTFRRAGISEVHRRQAGQVASKLIEQDRPGHVRTTQFGNQYVELLVSAQQDRMP